MGGVIPCSPALLACAMCETRGGVFPKQAHRTVPLNIQGWSWNGGRATMGKREISPPMGSIVSRNVGKRGSGAG